MGGVCGAPQVMLADEHGLRTDPEREFCFSGVPEVDAEVELLSERDKEIWEVVRGLAVHTEELIRAIEVSSGASSLSLDLDLALAELERLLRVQSDFTELVDKARKTYQTSVLVLNHAESMQDQARCGFESCKAHRRSRGSYRKVHGFRRTSSQNVRLWTALRNNVKKARETQLALALAVLRAEEIILKMRREVSSEHWLRIDPPTALRNQTEVSVHPNPAEVPRYHARKLVQNQILSMSLSDDEDDSPVADSGDDLELQEVDLGIVNVSMSSPPVASRGVRKRNPAI